MEKTSQTQQRKGGRLYRLEVEGAIGRSWSRRLAAESLMTRGSNTIILLRVVDQSDLFGRIRRIHDLNLRVISLERLDEDASPS